MLKVIRKMGMVHIVETDGGTIETLAVITPQDASNLAHTLFKIAAVTAALAEIKGVANEETYH